MNLLIAGFGGQGILFMGKVAAYTAMLEQKQVSWLPSYGPEMRGGTANCSVCIDEREISCPLVTEPETLVVMNQPSYDRFIQTVLPGGQVFLDSSLIAPSPSDEQRCAQRKIQCFGIPSTALAEERGLSGLANLVMLGKVLRETAFTQYDVLCEAMKSCVPASKSALVAGNLRAIELGYQFAG